LFTTVNYGNSSNDGLTSAVGKTTKSKSPESIIQFSRDNIYTAPSPPGSLDEFEFREDERIIFVEEIVFFFILALVETLMSIKKPKSPSALTGRKKLIKRASKKLMFRHHGAAAIVASSGSDSDTSFIQRCEY